MKFYELQKIALQQISVWYFNLAVNFKSNIIIICSEKLSSFSHLH